MRGLNQCFLNIGDNSSEAVRSRSQIKYRWISEMLDGVTHTASTDYKLSGFDRIATSPVMGKFLCFGIVLAAFLVAMLVMMPFMGIAKMIPTLLSGPIAATLSGWNVHPWITSIFSVLMPNVLYFCISMASFVFGVQLIFGFLEEIGFLARAAYQFDGILSKLGLHGKAVCPILMGFGCTIGGTCGTRVLDNWGQRM